MEGPAAKRKKLTGDIEDDSDNDEGIPDEDDDDDDDSVSYLSH